MDTLAWAFVIVSIKVKKVKMHTLASKSSCKDRELSPRYYYKLSEKISCLKRLKKCVRAFLAFLFTQVGVIMLIATYMVCGAAIFQNIEADSQMEVAVVAHLVRTVSEGELFTFLILKWSVWNLIFGKLN